MARLSIAPQAVADLEGIWDYVGLQKQNPSAARRQVETLYRKFALLAAHPYLGEVRDDLAAGVRSFVAGKYVVVYRPREDVVEVVRVVHAARDIRALFPPTSEES